MGRDPKSWRELFASMTPIMWVRFAVIVLAVVAGVAIVVLAAWVGTQ